MTERREPHNSKDTVELAEGPHRKIVPGVVTAVVVIGIVGVTLYVLQSATDSIIGTDGYFHIKYSYLMSHGHGMMRRLPWLYYTIHRDFYRDHHFLQHILYIPFTFGDLRLGAKLAAWLFGTLAMAAFYLVAARRGKAAAVILTLILLGSSRIFLTRIMMPRVMSMSMLALLLVFHTIMARRYRCLAAVMFGYVWLYDGFVLAILAMLCFFIADLMVTGTCRWRMLAWGFGGTIAGILINPYFPQNVGSYAFNFWRTATSAQLIKGTGGEWRPYNSWYLLHSARIVWIALGVGLVMAVLCRKPRRETVGLLLMALFVTVLAMKARRHMDIWAPIALLFVAHVWSDFWEEHRERSPHRTLKWRWLATALLAGLVAFTPSLCYAQWQKCHGERPFAYYKGAAEYLLRYAQSRTIVFNTDWDDFPYLFFFNSRTYYVVGLDQLYMAQFDQRLFDLWKAIRDGSVENPSRVIREEFGAEYVVVDVAGKQRVLFGYRAAADPNMRKVFQDSYCAVYRIVPSVVGHPVRADACGQASLVAHSVVSSVP